ncbi:MAG: hypothetical protein AVDCRST_MAG80-1831, partial [uncultured Rubrobacteraceae bacterium]
GPAQRPESDQPGGVAAVEDHPRHDYEAGDEGHMGGTHQGAGGGEDMPQGARRALRGALADEGAHRVHRAYLL